MIHLEFLEFMETSSPCLRTVYAWVELFGYQDKSINIRTQAKRPVSVIQFQTVFKSNEALLVDVL